MTIELTGRIPSKKNSLRRIKRGNRVFTVSSAAHERWHQEQSLLLSRRRNTSPLTGSITLTLHLYLKGKIDQDLDNAVSSLLDLFQDVGIIENDKDVCELHLFKHRGHSDFSATVEVRAQ